MRKPRLRILLLIGLVVLVAGLIVILRAMEASKESHPHHSCAAEDTHETSSPSFDEVRARDLARLTDPKARNWQLSPSLKVVTSASGLKYQDVQIGKGRSANAGDMISVEYVGFHTNGSVFDSSLKPGRTMFSFRLGAGDVIPGWDEGVAGMKLGGIRRLVVPPNLGYGRKGNPPVIGPNATLAFMVRIVEISSGPPDQRR